MVFGDTSYWRRPRSRRFKPFTPYKPSSPPPGSYDPALDAAVSGAKRGLFDLTQDLGTQGTRDTVDYGLGVNAINRQGDRSVEDLAAQRAGLVTSRDRGEEDYNRNLMLLDRSYRRLANTQLQSMNRAGILGGGAALQAAAKRAGNQAVDRQPLDTAHTRMLEDFATANRELDTRSGRLGEDRTLALADLARELAPPGEGGPLGGRRWQDRATQLSRAQRELAAFGLDTEASKAYQASGTGWDPMAGRPKGEFVDPKSGKAYRTVTRGGWTYFYDQSGHVFKRRAARR